MTDNEKQEFDMFLHESFRDGVLSRELRLSEDEAGYILGNYPRMSLELIADDKSPDGKLWYRAVMGKP